MYYDIDYYHPILPAVKLVCSIDFGINNQPDIPNAIHFRLINISTNNGERQGLVETASYVAHVTPDLSIQTYEAKNLWRRMGFGFICTGSLKEAIFLIEQCDIPSVIFVDEIYLELYINELTKEIPTEPFYHISEIPEDFNITNMGTNSHFRSWRLTKLIEKYQTVFFEYSKIDDILDCFKKIGDLKLPRRCIL